MAVSGRSLILGSASPRRLALLAAIGIVPDQVMHPGVDEAPHRDEAPRALCMRLARAKADTVAARSATWVLTADTVVAVGQRVLPGPIDPVAARRCLALLSGRKHRVYTAVVLRGPDGQQAERLSDTAVTFARLSAQQLEAYLAMGEWRGRAGGYAIQGMAAGFVRAISGSYSGVVGLPLFETAQLLRGQGWSVP